MGKVETGFYFCVTADILTSFTEIFLEWSSTNHMNIVRIADFDWWPWQPKGLIFEINIQKSSSQKPKGV